MRKLADMAIADLAAAVNGAHEVEARNTQSFLFYGPPKTGKTTLAAQIAEADEIDRVWLLDYENGYEAILTAYREGRLSKKALDKIILIRIPDTREDPNAVRTTLKTIASPKSAANICDEHGVVECTECKKSGGTFTKFQMSAMTKRDVIIMDTLSQLGTSAMNLACLGKPVEFKPGFDEFGVQGKYLSDILTVVQAAPYCIIICCTHVQLIEDDDGQDKYFPLCGTRNFSMNTAKYFGNVVFLERKLGKLKASSTIANSKTMAGSRLGMVLDKQKELNIVEALRETGFLTPTSDTVANAPTTAAVKEEPAKPSGLSRFKS